MKWLRELLGRVFSKDQRIEQLQRRVRQLEQDCGELSAQELSQRKLKEREQERAEALRQELITITMELANTRAERDISRSTHDRPWMGGVLSNPEVAEQLGLPATQEPQKPKDQAFLDTAFGP